MANLENSWADQMEAQDQTPAPAAKKAWGAVPQATPSRIGEDFSLPGVPEPKKDANADVRYTEDNYDRRGGYQEDRRNDGRGYRSDRGGGGDRYERGGGDRYGGGGGDRYERGGGDRHGGGYGGGDRGYGGGDRGYGGGDRGYGGDRGGDRYGRHRDYEDSRRESDARDSQSHSEHDEHRSEDRGEEDRRSDGERGGYDHRGYEDRRGNDGREERRGGYRHDDGEHRSYERREPRARVPVPDVPPFTAYVGNLPYQLTEADVADLFEPIVVAEVRLRKGFSYVEFNSREDLVEALNVAGKSVQGRDLKVDVAEPPRNREGGDRFDRDRSERRERSEAPSRGGRWEDDGRDRWTRGSELPHHEPAPRREPRNDGRDGRDGGRDYRDERRSGPPRLGLRPRSEAAEAKSPETARSSSIFGAAKPVDTAAVDRKREEERLQREEENKKRREEEKKKREEEAAAAPPEADKEKTEKTEKTERPERAERTERTEKSNKESPADGSWRRRDAPPARAWNKISEEQDRFDRGNRRGGRGGRGGASDRGGRRPDNKGPDNAKPKPQQAAKKESAPTSKANGFEALADAGDV